MSILFVTLHQVKKSENYDNRDTILRDNLKKVFFFFFFIMIK